MNKDIGIAEFNKLSEEAKGEIIIWGITKNINFRSGGRLPTIGELVAFLDSKRPIVKPYGTKDIQGYIALVFKDGGKVRGMTLLDAVIEGINSTFDRRQDI